MNSTFLLMLYICMFLFFGGVFCFFVFFFAFVFLSLCFAFLRLCFCFVVVFYFFAVVFSFCDCDWHFRATLVNPSIHLMQLVGHMKFKMQILMFKTELGSD